MTNLEPRLARALADTLLDLLPDYELGREDVARQAGVSARFVEHIYDPGSAVDPVQVGILAMFLGVDVEHYVANARRALD